MRSRCSYALALLAGMFWLTRAAQAQLPAGAADLTPLPSTATVPGAVQPAGYLSRTMSSSRVLSPPDTFDRGWDSGQCPSCDPAISGPNCNWCDPPCERKWYAVAFALGMTRNRAPAVWTTTTADDSFNLKMNTQNAAADWTGGGQMTIGYAFRGAGGPALAATYWGLAPANGSASVFDTTGNPATALNSTLSFNGTTINGQPASFYFDNASEQALTRQDRVNNFELNAISSVYALGGLQVSGLAGFRYFRFAEHLTYGSASFGNTLTSNGGADAAYLDIHSYNNLYGGQFGAFVNWVITPRLSAFAVPKVGLYGNQMNVLTQVYAGNAVNSPVVYYPNHKQDFAALSELDLGLAWAWRPNLRFIGGYRMVSVSNLALADYQYGNYGYIEQNGNLILHGAFLGLNWSF